MGRNYSAAMLKQLEFGAGETLEGDAALFLLKALLQSGISYMGGYPGAPTSTLFDAMSDAYDPILKPLGVYFEGSGNEAAAASLLQISVDNPIRGAVNWKVVGTNVASDVLAHVSSSGVKGGVVVFVGEDYGLDSTTVAEKTQPYALKSGMAVIDPPADPQRMADLVEEAFALSEASEMPVFYLLRTRVGNLKGSIVCRDNIEPQISTRRKVERLDVVRPRIPQPPFSLDQERSKFEQRIPAARRFITERGLNEVKGNADSRIGLITHGVFYNTTIRALHSLGLADLDGTTDVAILNLNVIEPLVPDQILDFIRGKDSVLIIEEGMPNLIEMGIRATLQECGVQADVHGKDLLPRANEYAPDVLIRGLAQFLGPRLAEPAQSDAVAARARGVAAHIKRAATLLPETLVRRSAIFCTGCPERPIFSALKIAEHEFGQVHYAGDIGCYSMGSFAPFFMTDSVTGMGTALATTGAMQQLSTEKMVSFMGDGTFWHSGLTTSFANSVYNNQDGVAVIFQNGWTSMTGEQENPASGVNNLGDPIAQMNIEGTLKAMGVKSVERVNPYNFRDSLSAIRRAMRSTERGLKVIISDAECMLQKQRRARPERAKAIAAGQRVADQKFGIDDDVCTGDHSCMRYNGCPSLTLKPSPNKLREYDIATINNSCVGCGLCGEVTHEAVLCPSFYRTEVVYNPTWWDRLWFGVHRSLIRAVSGVSV
ncbi:MAG: indolepyruvate ferredoxin oxidoreductase subunit alpha [Anaerolineae bacterium]